MTWDQFPNSKTHFALKLDLYQHSYQLMERGNMFEGAVNVLAELKEELIKSQAFEYLKLAGIHEKLAKSYRNIMNIARLGPQYVR